MKYDYELVEKADGKCSVGVFFKRDYFKCIKKDYINTDDSVKARPLAYCHLEEKLTSLKFVFAEV